MPLPAHARYERPLTEEELYDFSSINKLAWIEREADGTLYITARGDLLRSLVIGEIAHALTEWSRADRRGTVYHGSGWILPDGSMRGAPLAWTLDERMAQRTEEERVGFPQMAPDFFVEVLSTFDDRAYLEAKVEQWIANGVGLAWLIDYEKKRLTVHRKDGPPVTLNDSVSVEGKGPVRGFSLAMARIWNP